MPLEGYPLSSAQRRLWFLDQLSPGLAHYNVPLVFDVEGEVDLEILRRCLDELVRRHETLRTIFDVADGVPRQHILAHQPLQIPVEDLSHLPADERASTVDPLIDREIRRPFDLSTGPVLRAVVIRLTKAHHVFILTFHHIAFDAWSSGVIFRELAALYQAFSAGRASPLADLPMRYVDFALQQRAWMGSDGYARQLAYWRHQLRAPRPELTWSTERRRPKLPTYNGYRAEAALSESTLQRLQELSRVEGVTLFMTFTAAYAAFLHQLTGQADVIIGTPIAARTRQELEPLVGFFLNSLALRIDLSGHPTFRDLLARTRRIAIDAYANQDLPFERLVEELNPDRSLGHTPLAQTFLVVDGAHAAGQVIAVGDVIMRRRGASTGTAKFDMMLLIRRATLGRRVVVDVSADLFDAATAERVLRQFCHLIEQLVDHVSDPIDRLSIASAQDRRLLVESWNRTSMPCPSDSSLIDLFTAQVRLNPNSDAVLWGDRRVSYGALESRARQLASELQTRGVGSGDRVGLCMDRTPDLIASALAVLMIGGAYVPLDPMYPPSRLAFIVNDAGCRVVMTQESWLTFAGDLGVEPLVVSRIDHARLIDDPYHAATPTSLAYVMYTSGSTGAPKGVAIEHRQVVNLVTWANATFEPEERAGMLASTSMSFDLSVFEWFVPLCSGGTVILVDTLFALPESPAKDRVTFVNSVPSVVRELLRTATLPPSVSAVALAGEVLPQSLVRQVYEQPSVKKVFDLYGPTETTVYATCALRTPDGPETIGRPIANATAIVLNEQHELTPVGVAGELFIGGAGVGRGYFGRDDLTRERFVVDPVAGLVSGRMYRTGDRVRWRADGTLEFLGRLDRQVKLRGLRIELGEIEAALREHAAIADAAVVKVETGQPDRAHLVAFVVQTAACDDDDLYAHLEARLPHYMLPTRIDRVDALPRLPNGKVDLKALEGDANERPADRVLTAPRTATEGTIREIWSHLLERVDISVDDHFFRVGGHSLLATQLVVRINQHFGTSLDLATAFTAPTIAQQAQLIDELETRSPLQAESPSIDQQQLLEWAGVSVPYPRESSVCRLFEEQADHTPEAIAIVAPGQSLTYAQLNAHANQLAHHLISQLSLDSAEPLTVGISLPRSVDAVVSMLAVLKAGGGYVPLDPTLPTARLSTLAQRARVRAVIVATKAADQFGGIPLIDLEAEHAAIEAAPTANPDLGPFPDAIAYVLFTSGSSGDPKVVGVPHRAIVRLAYGMPDVHFGLGNTVAQLAPLSFDASTFEIWCPLLRGGRVALASTDVVTAASLRALLTSHDVTTMWLTASLFNAVVDEDATVFRSVNQLLIGGEVLSTIHVRRALEAAPALDLINGYGPTEATTFACLHHIEASAVEGAGTIPIGRPLLNTRVYLLDSHCKLVPAGLEGELWIGGDGLAAGYLDDPELTSERFVEDPFVDSTGARMYRSGDLARWRADGTLEFVGRLDDQIKLRGYRIEPGEVEAALAQHPAVQRSAVVAIDRLPIGRTLVAFIVFVSDLDLAERDELLRHGLRQTLRSRLPEYMVPSEWAALDALALLSSGKVDRRALAAMALAPVPKSDEASRPSFTAIEARVEEIWRALLGTDSINPADNFFDLGGHSLLATQAVSRIKTAFHVEFDLRSFFLAPTIAAVAATVERQMARRRSAPALMTRATRSQDLPLSYSQQRIWFLQRWYGDVGVYNVPSALRLEGVLNVDRLQAALQTIVNRHESLRTIFPMVNGLPVQRVVETVALPFDVIDLSRPGIVDAEAAARAEVTERSRHTFDLETGPLIRATLLQLTPTTSVLSLMLHHTVSDGWSMRVLFRELAALYRASVGSGPELPPLTLQYPDFAVWQRDYVNSAALEQQLAYWRQQLRSPIAQLEWPLDRPRPDTTTANGGRIVIELPVELSREIANFAAAQGATLFMTALAAFQTLLHRYTGQRDVLIGTPVANRTRPEIEGLIGCFINTLVMRGEVSGELTFRQLLARARQTAIDAQSHQDLPFELMVDALGLKRSASHSPLFQAMLVVNDGLVPALALDGLTVSRFPFSFDFAKFDITLDLWSRAGSIRGSLEYNADLFSAAFADRMVEDFVTLLRFAVAHPDRRISDIPLCGAVRDEGSLSKRPAPLSSSSLSIDLPSAEVIDLEQKLRPLWCRVLDVPAIDRTDDFFDLGGNSLKAVRLFAEIERDFGVRIPLSSLFRNGTIQAQASLLAAQRHTRQPWSVLVPLQPRGSRPPFFLVHGIGGEVLSFEALVRHLDDQPVFGLQAEYESADDDCLESIASRYVAAIRAQAPSGPYLLGGYSSGGVVAYEMAQQLVSAGEEVAMLAMVDASAPKVASDAVTPHALWRLVKNAAYWTLDDEFLRSDWANRRARVSSKLRAIRARRQHKGRRAALDAGADVRDLLGLWKVPPHARRFLERYVRMMVAYRPRPYRGTVSLLRARTLSLTYLGAEDFGWSQLANHVVVHHVPGAHDTILKEPRVRDLAAALSKQLRDSLEARGRRLEVGG